MPGRKVKNELDAMVNVRMPRKLLQELRDLAAREHRSLNGQIVHALEKHVAAPPPEQTGQR